MANRTTDDTIKRSDIDPALAEQARQLVANQAQQTAGKYLIGAGALGLGAGALRGIYNNFKARKKVNDLEGDLNFVQPTVPLGKTASLKSAGLWDFISGEHATGPLSVPWAMPGMLAAAYGGYQLGKKPVEAMGTGNIDSDTQDRLKKEKERYLQAARSAPAEAPEELAPQMPMMKAASFMDTVGWPALGIGAGGLGTAALANFLIKYHRAADKKQQAANQDRQSSLGAEMSGLTAKTMPGVSQPVSFS